MREYRQNSSEKYRLKMNNLIRNGPGDTNRAYLGDLVAGSLLVREIREITRLLLGESNKAHWDESVLNENVLQKRSPVSAKRQA